MNINFINSQSISFNKILLVDANDRCLPTDNKNSHFSNDLQSDPAREKLIAKMVNNLTSKIEASPEVFFKRNSTRLY